MPRKLVVIDLLKIDIEAGSPDWLSHSPAKQKRLEEKRKQIREKNRDNHYAELRARKQPHGPP
jgi:hypothetical protein